MEEIKLTKDLGKVYRLEINPDTRNISAEIALNGEKEPLKFNACYRTIENGIQITEISSEREWVNELFKMTGISKKSPKIALDSDLADLLKKFL